MTLRIIILAAILASPGSAAELTGKVVSVADGDTITLLVDKVETKIRLEGIDAPEKAQAFGTKAKEALAEKVFGKTVRVESSSKDRYGRTLGHVYLGEHWINRELISEGMAWHYKQYSKDERMAKAENEARQKKLGLWADKEPIPPWEFRKMNSRK